MIHKDLILFGMKSSMLNAKGSGGKPSGTGKPSGGGRDNNPPGK